MPFEISHIILNLHTAKKHLQGVKYLTNYDISYDISILTEVPEDDPLSEKARCGEPNQLDTLFFFSVEIRTIKSPIVRPFAA